MLLPSIDMFYDDQLNNPCGCTLCLDSMIVASRCQSDAQFSTYGLDGIIKNAHSWVMLNAQQECCRTKCNRYRLL